MNACSCCVYADSEADLKPTSICRKKTQKNIKNIFHVDLGFMLFLLMLMSKPVLVKAGNEMESKDLPNQFDWGNQKSTFGIEKRKR